MASPVGGNEGGISRRMTLAGRKFGELAKTEPYRPNLWLSLIFLLQKTRYSVIRRSIFEYQR